MQEFKESVMVIVSRYRTTDGSPACHDGDDWCPFSHEHENPSYYCAATRQYLSYGDTPVEECPIWAKEE